MTAKKSKKRVREKRVRKLKSKRRKISERSKQMQGLQHVIQELGLSPRRLVIR